MRLQLMSAIKEIEVSSHLPFVFKGAKLCSQLLLGVTGEDDKLCSQLLLAGIEEDICALLLLAIRGGDKRLQLISATNGGEVSSHLPFVFTDAKLWSQLLFGVTGEEASI